MCSHICSTPDGIKGERTRNYAPGDLPCRCGENHAQCPHCGAIPLQPVPPHPPLVDGKAALAALDQCVEALGADYGTMIRMGWGCSTDPLLRHCAEFTRAALEAAKKARGE